MQLQIGDRVYIKHTSGMRSLYTPNWCLCWTGTIVRLNKLSATVEFEVNEPGRKTLKRYIDYDDIQVIKE